MKYPTLMDRIIANSVIDAEHSKLFEGTLCWVWIGKFVHGRNGRYPAMNVHAPGTKSRAKRELAHRMAIKTSGRQLGPKQIARHMCDNSWCVNPAHLRVGTSSQNRKDQLKNKARCSGP